MPRRLAALLLAALAPACHARVGASTIGNDAVPPPRPLQPAPLQIAGQPVVRVGINFEDLRRGDADYNDAVLCFEGDFKVRGTEIVSTEYQDVVAFTSSLSVCRHHVRVEVLNPDGTREPPILFDSRSGAQVPITFRPGSRLEVFMTPYEGDCGDEERSMHDAGSCQVLLDRCNTTGQ
jgi:hypothetical protein